MIRLNKKSNRLIKGFFVTFLVISWLLAGFPSLYIPPKFNFPPKIAGVQASTLPTFVAAGAVANGVSAITPALPAGIATNDILLLFIKTSNQAITIPTPNGGTWTEVTNSPQGTGAGATTTSVRLTVFWSRYNGTQGAPTTSDSGDDQLARMIAVRGAVTSGNPWNITAGSVDATANTSGSIPGATTTVDNTFVVAAIATALPDANGTANFSSETNASLGSVTEQTDNTVTSGLGGGLNINTGTKAAAGAYSATTVTLGASSVKAEMSIAIMPPLITTLGNGASEPSNVTIGPGGSITDLDNFTLQSDTGSTDTVTAAVVTLGPAGAFNNIAQVDITDTSNVAKCTAVTNPSSITVTFSTCTISVTTTLTTYKIRITPKTHANMPAPPGASYATTGTITSFTSTNAQAGTDSGSATVTVDNLSPNGATSVSGSAGNTAVTLNWTSSSSTDFDTTNGSVILRWAAASAGTEVPAEGNSSYTAGNTITTATVACVISSATSTALSKIDGTGGSVGCTTTALTNGQAYTYKAFQRDTNGNYDVGVSIGTFTPSAASASFTQNKYRWYQDNDLANPTTAWGTPALAENTAIPIIPAGEDPPDTTQKLRLRVNLKVNTAALSASSAYFKLEYKAGTDGSCTTGTWTDVGTGAWVYATSTVTDGANVTASLSDTTTGKGEQYAKSKPTALNNIGASVNEIIEYDFHVIGSSATANTQYSFRVVQTNSTASTETVLDAYTNCATLTTEPGTSDLMRHGNVFTNGSEQGFFWAN